MPLPPEAMAHWQPTGLEHLLQATPADAGADRHAGHVPTGGRRDPPGRLISPPCPATEPRRVRVFMTSNPQKVHLLKSSICYTALE
jgi:hypothetical protein